MARGARGHGWATVPCMFPQVPPEVWAADEQDWLLLLEPEEFLQGVVQLTQALVLLQLWANMDVLLVASWQELSQHVCAFTKALTQRPFKQSRESGAFSFCTTARWAAAEKSGKRWHRPAGGLVAADQAVQLCQPGCGQCCCCCLPFPLPSATGLNAARPGNRLETTSGGVREQDTQYDLHRGSQAGLTPRWGRRRGSRESSCVTGMGRRGNSFSPGDAKPAGRSGEDVGRAHMPWALYTLAEGLLASYDRQEGLGSLRAPQGKCRSLGGCGAGEAGPFRKEKY
uniref:Uncharacterized protein n=1 Tax=Monodon monoceros TaxID=40151 RepID=A0A8C6F235_MONMO